jgi:hypothetical protein
LGNVFERSEALILPLACCLKPRAYLVERLEVLNESQVTWATEVDGNSWRIRINNFPNELMHGLMIGNGPAMLSQNMKLEL